MSIVKDIKSLEIQGANTIAIKSLEHLKKFSSKNGFQKKFDKEAKKLVDARPTAVVLYNVLKELEKDKSKEKINQLLSDLKKSNELIAKKGTSLIKSKSRVHTHCHSSTVMDVLKKAAEKKKFTVTADETRPRNQGIKTVKELSKIKNIDVVLVTDGAASLSFTKPVMPIDDMVIVGSDSMRNEGFVNKTGTYFLALAASEANIPFYVAASLWKIDDRKNFEIEMRKPDEIHKKMKNVKIVNPAFDITPWKYVTGVITEEGIKKPKDILKMLR